MLIERKVRTCVWWFVGEGVLTGMCDIVAKCPNEKCESRTAYFRQVQIRSADEPMTSFYKCVECATEWREN